ncbi:MAG: glycoside hydrolase family 127 protein [Bacteroidota bacterium]|nr:glycoside hydrolase family 127 protein [Bacteroidota bacterium]
MKLKLLFFAVALTVIFSSCKNDPNRLSVINSESFHESIIHVDFQPDQTTTVLDSLAEDSVRQIYTKEQYNTLNQIEEMLSMAEKIRKSGSDSLWTVLSNRWNEFNVEITGNGQANSATNKVFPEAISKWAELNVALVKLSGEVRFGDAIEKMLHGPENSLISERLLKSVIYTHVDDKIFINIIGPSSMEYQHTTGGNVRLMQETDYPEGDVMTLKSKCGDKRFMDVFIRIPSWAVNPTVTHGNVKYVARPGEYTQISRKWKDGDEFMVDLKN